MDRRIATVALVGACVAAMASTLRAAEVYRWVDEDGRVHFSDRPRVAGERPLHVETRAPAPGPDDVRRRERRDRLLEVFAEERRRAREQAREARARAQARQKACAEARATLARLERGGVFYEVDAGGRRAYLDEAALERRRAWWRGQVERVCDGE